MKTIFICAQCHKEITHEDNFTTGYGINKNNQKICYPCCAINDKNDLLSLTGKQKLLLYFNGKEVINWPGSLKITPTRITKGKHNFCRVRTDVYFKLENKWFHGLNLGNMDILHVNAIL
jgi:hypothetical protein